MSSGLAGIQPSAAEIDTAPVREIVAKHAGQLGALIAILEEVQERYGYLPEKAVRAVADATGRPLVEVYGVATFYKAFRLRPRGRHYMVVCMGTACHVRGGVQVVEEFERQLGVGAGETTPDGAFTLETVNCLGACALGPIVVADGRYFPQVNPTSVKKILQEIREGEGGKARPVDPSCFPLDVSCPACGRSLMNAGRPLDGQPSVLLTFESRDAKGWIRLSCLYGSQTIESEHRIPSGEVARFYCPHCTKELPGGAQCMECDAGMASLRVHGGGTVSFCVRRGCKGHQLEIGGLSA